MSLSTGNTSLALNVLPTQTHSPAAGSEQIFTSGQCYTGPFPWFALGGSTVRVGASGNFVVTGSAVTLRIRTGFVPPGLDTSPQGTIVHSVTIPVGTTVLDEISAAFALPTNVSNFQITTQQASGSCTITGLFGYIVPDGDFQGEVITEINQLTHSTTVEVLRMETLINFAKYDTPNVLITWAARNSQQVGETGIYRMRLGGTVGTVSGTVIGSIVDTAGSAYVYSSAVIPNPGGVQVLKFSVQSLAGFSVAMDRMSVLIRGAY
jgi:hypothetical protein